VRDMPSMARIDADRSLGHPVSAHAMNLAVDKCLRTRRRGGRGVQTRTTSARPACYAKIAADRGVIGMVTSAHPRGSRWCPRSRRSRSWGRTPLALRGGPAKKNASFELDMATTTVAAGKVKVYKAQPQSRCRRAGWWTATGGR